MGPAQLTSTAAETQIEKDKNWKMLCIIVLCAPFVFSTFQSLSEGCAQNK